jgi:hypothetical protein
LQIEHAGEQHPNDKHKKKVANVSNLEQRGEISLASCKHAHSTCQGGCHVPSVFKEYCIMSDIHSCSNVIPALGCISVPHRNWSDCSRLQRVPFIYSSQPNRLFSQFKELYISFKKH